MNAAASSTTSTLGVRGAVVSPMERRSSGASQRSGQNTSGEGEKLRGSRCNTNGGKTTLFPSGMKLRERGVSCRFSLVVRLQRLTHYCPSTLPPDGTCLCEPLGTGWSIRMVSFLLKDQPQSKWFMRRNSEQASVEIWHRRQLLVVNGFVSCREHSVHFVLQPSIDLSVHHNASPKVGQRRRRRI